MVNPAMFREYDIRGISETDLNDSAVEQLGKGIGTYMRRAGKRNISLGRDCRLSSERLRNALSRGLNATGVDVTDIGECPTPVTYFSLHHLNLEGAVMITGSHNPPNYNGFKICVGHAAIYGDQIQAVRHIIERGDFISGQGQLTSYDILTPYKEYLISHFKLRRPIRMVVDAGNGMAGNVAPAVFKALGCQVTELFCTLDGTFPNHHPDPTVVANMQETIKKVLEIKAEVGIAYDGDADRIGVVDDKGNIIWGDRLLILYARAVLQRLPGAPIISEVKASKTLYDDIAKHGGRPIMWKTGHSLIKAKMKEEYSPLAGEMSGHMFFADRYFGYDDAIYASCRLLEILDNSPQKLSDLLNDVPKTVVTPEIRVDCPEEKKFKLVARLQDYFKTNKFNVVDIDGVRVLFDDGWGLVRASNTGPVLVLRFEGPTEARVQEIRNLIEGKLREFQSS
ncbi:MAG: phosphomannomutase/phosphoglucomutase [Acidobacteria bacterium]|nr:phosphomannomutase/phosphoglucomutase [Acidobacteriota bacterium]MBI3657087.1 phosphomannomutase/phosphoglucomutase [Acidobacteriota bacterium]